MGTMTRTRDADGVERDARALECTGHEGDHYPMLRWYGKRLTHADFTAAATSEAVKMFDIAAGTIIHDAFFQLDTVFSGGSVSAITGALGISGGDVDGFVEEVDIFTGATTGRLFTGTRGVLLAGSAAVLTDSSGGTASDTIADAPAAYTEATVANTWASLAAKINGLLNRVAIPYDVGTSAIEVDMTAVATGDNVVNLTAGSITAWLLVSDPVLGVLET